MRTIWLIKLQQVPRTRGILLVRWLSWPTGQPARRDFWPKEVAQLRLTPKAGISQASAAASAGIQWSWLAPAQSFPSPSRAILTDMCVASSRDANASASFFPVRPCSLPVSTLLFPGLKAPSRSARQRWHSFRGPWTASSMSVFGQTGVSTSLVFQLRSPAATQRQRQCKLTCIIPCLYQATEKFMG